MLTFVTFHVDSSKETAKKIYNQDIRIFVMTTTISY